MSLTFCGGAIVRVYVEVGNWSMAVSPARKLLQGLAGLGRCSRRIVPVSMFQKDCYLEGLLQGP